MVGTSITPKNKLPNGSASTYFGDKHAYKRRPSDGPAKNKQRPVPNPIATTIGLKIKGALNDAVDITPCVL